MSGLHLNSSQLSRFVYIFDDILCTKLGNPVILSVLAIALGSTLSTFLMSSIFNGYKSAEPRLHDYYLHFIHNLVNLIFIVRFPTSDREGLLRKSNKAFELCFFVIQNIGILFFFMSLKFTFLSSDYNIILRIFMQCQIICPYAILAMSLSEKYFFREGSEKEPEVVAPKSSILAETNNNLLPIFMANSFAYIRLAYPLADAPVLVIFNNIVCFCLKVTLIHRFILHGVVIVINKENVKSYTELYRPVELGNKKASFNDLIRRHETSILKACMLLLLFQDMGLIGLFLVKSLISKA